MKIGPREPALVEIIGSTENNGGYFKVGRLLDIVEGTMSLGGGYSPRGRVPNRDPELLDIRGHGKLK